MPTKNSLIRVPDIPFAAFALGAVLLFVIGFMFFIEQILFPPCCDADQYLKLARISNAKGIIAVQVPSLTFAYPWILSLIIEFSNIINLPEKFLIFLAQISAYYLALVIVSNIIKDYSRKLATAIYLALCVNIFAIPYTGITLTDSLYTSLAIVLFGGMMKIEHLQKSEKVLPSKWIFWGTFLLSLSITIRPAAIWLFAPAFFCLAKLIWMRSIAISNVLLAVILGAAPLYIQIMLNVTNYRIIRFLPVADLGGMQIIWGIKYIKYATWLGGGDPQMFYTSGSLIKTHGELLNIWWYFNNPIDAVKLLAYKFVGAFDFDYIVPYIYKHHGNKWLYSFFSFTILWGGVFGVFAHLFTNKLVILGSRFMPFIIFIGWCSISLISALELRFTLPIISYFIIVSCVVLNHIIVEKNKSFLLYMVFGWIISMAIFYQMASFVRLQSVVLGI